MIEKFTRVFKLLGEIEPLMEKKVDFPNDLELSKEFYDNVHSIGYTDITICEKIINISSQVLKNLNEIKNQFSQTEYNLVKSVCEKTINHERSEIITILDLLIGVDKSIKYWQKLNISKLDHQTLLEHGINPNISEIDVI